MLFAIILATCSVAFPVANQVSIQGRAFQGPFDGSEAIAIPPLPPLDGCSDPPEAPGTQQWRPQPSSSSGDGALLVGSREFALNLFKTAVTSDSNSATPDNVFLSPVSVWLALVSTFFGARGETASQLASLLSLPTTDRNQLANELARLRERYEAAPTTAAGSGNTLRLASRFYFESGLALCPRVVDRLGGVTAVQQLNFATASDTARRTINSWVASATESKITDLLAPSDVDKFTRLVLANAAYFRGTWSIRFDAKRTRSQKFYTRPETSGEEHIRVAMMQVRDTFPYINSRALNAKIVELPFAGGDLSFFAAFPNVFENSVETLVSQLSVAAVREALTAMQPRTLTVSLPRLRIERSLELSDALTALGAGAMFDRARSDLSGFVAGADGQRLDVGAVRHKAFLEVNEVGAEAAAATAVVIQTYSAIQDDVVTFNRPFVFFIRDNRLDSILFVGLVRRPPTV